MTPAEIRETLLDLGNTLFPVAFESYLTAQGKPLWGLLIEPEHRRFSELFGGIPDRDLRLFNTWFADTKAGFATSARSVFQGLSCNPDVFLLAKEGLGWSRRDLASIVIHELCHWYTDSDQQASHPVTITEAHKDMGKKLYERTDRHNVRMTRHTVDFCELLCAVSTLAVESGKASGSAEDLVDSAMRFDVVGGF
nr:hypothetical protein [Burkholderia ambifaria]